LTARATRNDSLVIEQPFNAIDITSDSKTYSIGLSHPLMKDLYGSLALGLALERRESKTFLLGEPFSFSPGIPDGESKVDVARFSQDWLRRDANRVLALRSTFSKGSTNATPQVGGLGPKKRFLSWLGQFQWAQLHAPTGGQFIARADAQYAKDALMPIEKFAFGGMTTVRGYRENQVLRDRGYVLSAEYRYPVYSDMASNMRLYIAPFADYGRGWNADTTPAKPDSLSSAGVGFLFEYGTRFQAQLYLAKPFRKIPQAEHDLQDSGIHFSLVYHLF
jgi:hemolysin activation/secretion protein